MAITFFSINGAGGGGGGTTVVHTNNGISGDGSIATPVILGGNPLTGNTNIDTGQTLFIQLGDIATQKALVSVLAASGEVDIFAGVAGGATGSLLEMNQAGTFFAYNLPTSVPASIQFDSTGMEISSDDGTGNNTIVHQQPGLFRSEITDVPGNIANISETTGLLLISVFDNGTGKTKQLDLSRLGGTGIQITDQIDSLGLLGQANYSAAVLASAGGLAYPQLVTVQGLIAAAPTPKVASINVPGVNSTQTLNYVVGATAEFVRTNDYAFFRSGLGSVTVSVNFTDNAGTPRTIIRGTINAGAVFTSDSPETVQAQALSTISIVYTLTGAMIFDAVGTIEKLL